MPRRAGGDGAHAGRFARGRCCARRWRGRSTSPPADVFAFAGERCDRIVAGVLARCAARAGAATAIARLTGASGRDSGAVDVIQSAGACAHPQEIVMKNSSVIVAARRSAPRRRQRRRPGARTTRRSRPSSSPPTRSTSTPASWPRRRAAPRTSRPSASRWSPTTRGVNKQAVALVTKLKVTPEDNADQPEPEVRRRRERQEPEDAEGRGVRQGLRRPRSRLPPAGARRGRQDAASRAPRTRS